jgi:hypothetical protein
VQQITDEDLVLVLEIRVSPFVLRSDVSPVVARELMKVTVVPVQGSLDRMVKQSEGKAR